MSRVVIQARYSGVCPECEERWDHTGDDKSDSVSQLMTKGSFEAFVAEIAKCEVVCANCHRIRTRSRQAVTFGRVRR